MRTVLHVGCGPKSLKDLGAYFQDGTWTEVRLDIDPRVHPDVIGTLTDMSAVPSGSVQALISWHNIEHMFWHEVPLVLAEFKRVLADDGFAHILCPDLQKVAELVAADQLLAPAYVSSGGPVSPLDMIYGFGAAISAGNHFMAHRCGFTKTTLNQAIVNAGFRTSTVGRTKVFELAGLATRDARSEHDRRSLFEQLRLK